MQLFTTGRRNTLFAYPGEVRWLKMLEDENRQLKKLVACLSLDK